MIQTQEIIEIVEGKTIKIVEMIVKDHLHLLQVAQVVLHHHQDQDLNQANQNDIYCFKIIISLDILLIPVELSYRFGIDLRE